jgi:hypothetical protein
LPKIKAIMATGTFLRGGIFVTSEVSFLSPLEFHICHFWKASSSSQLGLRGFGRCS